MPQIAVVADSACDLPAEIARAAGIRIVPLIVTFGEESFLDRVELTAEAFWERVAGDGSLPTTASPSPEALVRVYEAAAADGATGVVSVHLSEALSRTSDTARIAGERSPIPVEVVDSRSVSLGEGLVALEAAKAAGDGGGLEAVALAARDAAARLAVCAFLDTVDFLQRGGRLGRAKATLSDLLRIRPVLSMADGEPVLVSRARTRSKALEEVFTRTAGLGVAAAVLHSNAPEVEDARSRVAATSGVEPITALIGPVTGAHLGPRSIGVAVVRSSP